MLIKCKLLLEYIICKKRTVIAANLTHDQPNIEFALNGFKLTGLVDTGSYFCILPYLHFLKLIFSPQYLNTNKQYSIQSATELQENAVLGTITLEITIQNKDTSF